MKLFYLSVTAILLMVACNSNTSKTDAKASKTDSVSSPVQKTEIVDTVAMLKKQAVKASVIIEKYRNSAFRKEKLARGIISYNDTSFEKETFVVTDVVKEISTDNGGTEYAILYDGEKGVSPEELKCYFINKADINLLSVGKPVTLISKRNIGIIRSRKIFSETYEVIAIQMECAILK